MDGRVGAKGNEVEKIGNMDVLIKSRRDAPLWKSHRPDQLIVSFGGLFLPLPYWP